MTRLAEWVDFTAPTWGKRVGGALALLPLPALLVVAALLLKDARGPFWLGKNSDPDYPYLFNALVIAQIRSPGHIDHPGTTLQAFGAVVLRVSHAVAGIGDLEDDVLDDPEFYLTNIHQSMIVVGALVLFACGVLTLWATRNLALALVSQLPPFLSTMVMFVLTGVWVEPPLFLLTLLFGAVTLLFLEGKLKERPRLAAVLFGMLTGLALATKITAVPLVVVPLLLLPWRSKIAYGAWSAAAFFLATLPILPKYRYFLAWVGRLGTHTGAYGEGERGFIDPEKYLPGLWFLAKNECILFAVLLVSVAVLAIWPVLRLRLPPPDEATGRAFRGLLAVTLTQIAQILLVAKQPDTRYLMPALGLVGVNLVLVCRIGYPLWGPRALGGFGLVLAAALLLQGWWTAQWHGYLKSDQQVQQEFFAETEAQFAESRVVYYYSASSPLYALWFGNYCTLSWEGEHRGRYAEKLQALYPDALFWDIGSNQFCDFVRDLDLDEVKQRAGKRPLVMVGWLLEDDFARHLPESGRLERVTSDKTNLQEAACRMHLP